MARQSPHSKGRFASERDFIEKVASAIPGVQMDSPEFDRVTKILHKTLHGIDTVKGQYQFAKPDFIEATRYLPLKTALELFEEVNLERFSEQCEFAKELSSQYNSFYSISDWEIILEKFLEHQAENKDSLLETGYPEGDFTLSPSLDLRLGRLYFLKYRFESARRRIWRKKTGTVRIGKGRPCGYRDAPYLESLGDGARVLDNAELRSKVFSFKQETLQCLHSHLKKSPPESMGSKRGFVIATQCLAKMKAILTMEEIAYLHARDTDYYLRRELDLAVLKKERALPTHGDSDIPLFPGGLSDIIGVIGDITAEIAVRPRTDTRINFYLWERENPPMGIKYDLGDFYRNYARRGAQWFEEEFSIWQGNKEKLEKYIKTYHEQIDQMLEVSTSEWLFRLHELIHDDVTAARQEIHKVSGQLTARHKSVSTLSEHGPVAETSRASDVKPLPEKEMVSEPVTNSDLRLSALKNALRNVSDWSEVTISTTDGYTLRIFTRTTPRGIPLSYYDMGAENKTSKKPNTAWKTFIECLEKDGLLKAEKTLEGKNARKQTKRRIFIMLKEAFDLPNDPFHEYQRGIGWRLKCQVK